MLISDLAALVTVRNHINSVLNDKSITSKEDFRPLNEIRIRLDKKFVEKLKELDVNNIGTPEMKYLQLEPNDLLKNDPDFQLFSGIDPDNKIDTAQFVSENKIDHIPAINQKELALVAEESEDNELALIAARVKEQKAQLSKQGRSNKRTSKAKEDASEK